MSKHLYIKPVYGKHWRKLHRHQRIQAMLDIIYELKLEYKDAKEKFKEYYGEDVKEKGGVWRWYMHLFWENYKSSSKRKSNLEERNKGE